MISWSDSDMTAQKWASLKKTKMFQDPEIGEVVFKETIDNSILVDEPELMEMVKDKMRYFSKKENDVFWMRMKGLTYKDIAKKYKVTHERVRQLERRVIRVLSYNFGFYRYSKETF